MASDGIKLVLYLAKKSIYIYITYFFILINAYNLSNNIATINMFC